MTTPTEAITIGTRVLRKRGTDARVGTVVRFVAWQRVEIAWPAPRRINGCGTRKSPIGVASIVPATDEEVERRRAINRAAHEAARARADAERIYLCTNVNPLARASNDGHPGPLPLLPSQVQDGVCRYCGGAVIERSQETCR
jgi:hypothetical protein